MDDGDFVLRMCVFLVFMFMKNLNVCGSGCGMKTLRAEAFSSIFAAAR